MPARATTIPDLTPETWLTTVQLAKVLASHGGACAAHRMTINRWCSKGVGVAGSKVKLAAVRQGSKWLVRWGDFLAFRERCTQVAGGETESIQTPTERRRAAEAALREMNRVFDAALGRKPQQKPQAKPVKAKA